MTRLDALTAIGGFDASLRYAMDLDAFLKLRSLGRFASTRIPVSPSAGIPSPSRSRTGLDRVQKPRHQEASSPARLEADQLAVARPGQSAAAWAARRLNSRAAEARTLDSDVG